MGSAVFVVLRVEVKLEETAAFESEQVEDEAHAGKQAKINTSKTRQSFPPLYERDSCSGLCVCATCQPFCPSLLNPVHPRCTPFLCAVPSSVLARSNAAPTHIAPAPPQ